ncbi:MAG: phosphate-binding protein, partial [Gammaproteobacteria bacterium]|nr:phosphate-binding protein [Gammaproteobacteria bacterium]
GMKLFCAGADMDTPDITNASRRMKTSEFETCQKNGVKDITEAVIGYDGIAIAQSVHAKALNLTREDILLAVAEEVPNAAGTGLVKNSYTYWDEIDAKLPHRRILFYGPPTSSGTRDAFEDLGMKHLTKHMDAYGKKKYHKIRQDGAYVPSGENDNLIVQKLTKDDAALGIFGYSYLEENGDILKAATVDGIGPEPDTISSGKYPLSRSLYFYIKKSHEGQVKGIAKYVSMFMGEPMIGKEGNLAEIGLIPLPDAFRNEIRDRVEKRVNLTLDDLKKK